MTIAASTLAHSGSLKVRAISLHDHHIPDWGNDIEDRYEYGDFVADPALRRQWISFDSVLADGNRVYLGITSFDADIFRAYDRRADAFIDLGYSKIADKFDAKFHRALIRSRDGNIYGAIALLHDVDQYFDAPGGAIVRYNPDTGALSKIGIPIPHVYTQAMAIDEDRRIAYCQHFTPEYLSSTHLDTGEVRNLGLVGSGLAMGQGENIVLDAKGRLWGAWSVTRAWQNNPGVDQYRLFRYDPEVGRIEFFRHGIPHIDPALPGADHIDGLIAAPNGMLYCGSKAGGLFRIDPETAEVTLIGSPVPPRRIAAFDIGPDGHLYGIGGCFGHATLFRMDLQTEEYQVLGRIADPVRNASAWQIHCMSFAADGTLYGGENDNPRRSSYLWEIGIEGLSA